MMDILFILVVWIGLLFTFKRAWQRRDLEGQHSLLIWSLFLCVGFSFIFRAPLIEATMNDQFNDLPVAYWFKSLFVLLATGLYTRMLQHIHPASYPRSAWLLCILFVALIGNIGLIFLGAERVLSPQQTYYSMMTLADLAVMLNMVLLFLPVNLIMYHQEQLEPMRMKHIATLIFCTFYTIAAAMTQVLGPYTVVTGRVSPLHNLIPLGMIVFFCFMIPTVPEWMQHPDTLAAVPMEVAQRPMTDCTAWANCPSIENF